MDTINDFFALLSGFLWGWPMIILLLGTHIFLTFRLGIPQRKLLTGIRLSVKKDDKGRYIMDATERQQALAELMASDNE